VKNKRLQWTRPIFILAGATIEAHVWNDGTGASSFSAPMHQQSRDSVSSINIYRPAPVRVPSPTLHISSPLHPSSPNRKNLYCRSRRSEAWSTQCQRRLCPPRWVHRPRRLPPHESPASACLLLSYTLPSLSISPSRYGEQKDQGSKHHHLAIRDPRHRGIQSDKYIVVSPHDIVSLCRS
jgi:hypothetical protein